MRLTKQCPVCTKIQELITETPIGDEVIRQFKCGHSFVYTKEFLAKNDFPVTTFDGKKTAYPYQVEGVRFALESDYNCLIADQMGLGKTIQALLGLRANYDSLTPALILVRSATTYQWIKEYKEWCDPTPLGIFMIQGSKSFIPPGFKSYVMSMDTLSRNGMTDRLKDFGFKLIIVDEAHSFKNPDSKRSVSLVNFIKELNFVEYQDKMVGSTRVQELKTQKKAHLILLTGTPIKNRADEYFIPLNLLKPEAFPSIERFRKRWLMQDNKGKWSRVSPYALDSFHDTLKPFVLRRERNEVLPDLPPFRRDFTEISVEDESLMALYNAELEKLKAKDAERELNYWDIQENLMTMRRILGVAKVNFAYEYVETFLDTTENEKICIGVHHKSVRDLLKYKLDQHQYHPLTLSGEDSAEAKNYIVQEFAKSERRVLIANMLAGGVGLNLQFCNNAIVLERQWSPADEEQFEGRFNRPGQTRPVTAEYLVAKGTIDEYFHTMVEEKRAIFGETIGENWSLANDQQAVSELVNWVTNHPLK